MKHKIQFINKIIIALLLVLGITFTSTGQHVKVRGRGHHKAHHRAGNHRHHDRMVIRRSIYRPSVVVVHRPVWAKQRVYNRRWVYFPRYNMYWDNWRNKYVYRSNAIWIVNDTPPPTVINVNIEEEKSYELKEDNDDIDEVYNDNSTHEKDYQ